MDNKKLLTPVDNLKNFDLLAFIKNRNAKLHFPTVSKTDRKFDPKNIDKEVSKMEKGFDTINQFSKFDKTINIPPEEEPEL